jgi:hypothetical protein
MCVTQCKFLILLYFFVFNCELCVTLECKLYVHTDTTTDYNDKRLTNDRPDLSSERAPQIRQDCNLKKIYLWSEVPDWARHQDILTD